ncbi:MAG: MgtC/SapB family protein [Planctomycetaceae bacterium]|nr:MgtC/SapB family protein [Planctomycetaceae bacterium]
MELWDVVLSEVQGSNWLQFKELVFAFVLSSLIGLEREIKLKSAGLRTHALVGMGAALIMLVSKWGFADVPQAYDPSRVAAQIVSGIGFIGGGLIFVRKDIVHGLTTAATIWVTAGVGMACGGGLYLLALCATASHFIVAIGYTRVMHKLLGVTNRLIVRYSIDSKDAATRILGLCASNGFTIRTFSMKTEYADPKVASMMVRVVGSKSVEILSEAINKIPDVISVKVNVTKEDD